MNRSSLLAAGLCALAIALLSPAAQAQVAAPPPPPAPAELTADQWRADLRFMVGEMRRRHPNLHHAVSREVFDTAVADLDARIPTLQRNEIIVGMMRIAALVGDGHTRVDPRKDARFGFASLPLKLYLFEDGLYVRAAAPAYADLVGARIESFGGVPAEEALARVEPLASRDNVVGPKLFAPLYLAMPDILQALHLSPRRDIAVLGLSRGGRRWTATVPAADVEPRWPPDTDISLAAPPAGWVDAHQGPAPLWLQAPLDYHRMIDLPGALYAQLNMVTDTEAQSLDAFGAAIEARARATNPRAVILDLRLDQGGDGSRRNSLVRSLIRSEDADTRLIVLTWRGTFSASQFILNDLDRLSGAVVIGEPASSKPSSYGDAYRSPMPNSGIDVRTSILWWQEGQDTDPWTWVDVATPLRFADYAAGRDPALEAALAYVPGPSLQDRLLAAERQGGPEAVRRVLDGVRRDPANRYANLALQMAQTAERLFNGGHEAAGYAAAQAGAEAFPDNVDSVNVYAHVAEAAGRRAEAQKAAERVLQLDPDSRTARALLERLKN